MDVTAGLGSFLDGLHDVQDMIGQFTRSPVGLVPAQAMGHVGHADAPAHCGRMAQRHLVPGAVAGS
jgi:hypothetical protein